MLIILDVFSSFIVFHFVFKEEGGNLERKLLFFSENQFEIALVFYSSWKELITLSYWALFQSNKKLSCPSQFLFAWPAIDDEGLWMLCLTWFGNFRLLPFDNLAHYLRQLWSALSPFAIHSSQSPTHDIPSTIQVVHYHLRNNEP